MGVDFMNCNSCEEIMSDCGDYAYCDKCGKYLCDVCMYKFKVDDEMFDLENAGERKCPFCSKVVVTTEQLLDYALEELSLTRAELTTKYKGGA